MNKKIILTKGLPASGKSTWAKQEQKRNPNIIRVNKDDLRAMLHDSVFSKGREEFVLSVRNFIVEKALKEGHDVIVDDTNFHSKHKNEMWRIASKYDAVVSVEDFTHVPLDECMRRDSLREKKVGAKVIRQMYDLYIKPTLPVYTPDPSLEKVFLCDLDGTLAITDTGKWYDRDYTKDYANQNILDLAKKMNTFYRVIFVSGRKETFKDQTIEWLLKHYEGLTSEYIEANLFMRKANDNRKDDIVKKEIFEAEIKDKYAVQFILDDRNQVVDMWRSLGLTVLQVAEGNF